MQRRHRPPRAGAGRRPRKADCGSSTATCIRASTASDFIRSWQALAGASQNLWRPSAHALYRHHALSALFAADRAPRCLAADRRAAGSDLDFMRKQHLDPHRRRVRHPAGARPLHLFAQSLEFGAAIQRAINDWQLAHWANREPRLKASIVAGQDDTRWRSLRSIAVRKSASIFADQRVAARQRAALVAAAIGRSTPRPGARPPLGIHVGGYGGHAPTGGGWPSYYCEEHQATLTRLRGAAGEPVIEGIPERFPKLKIVFIEGGFGWIASTMWRMDQHFERFRSEVPHLKRRPSEYVKGAFLVHHPADRRAGRGQTLRQLIEWVGVDRLLFSSDYPHCGFRRSALCLQDAADRDRARENLQQLTPARSTA